MNLQMLAGELLITSFCQMAGGGGPVSYAKYDVSYHLVVDRLAALWFYIVAIGTIDRVCCVKEILLLMSPVIFLEAVRRFTFTLVVAAA